MYGANRYGSENMYNSINESIDEMYTKVSEENPNLTADEKLDVAIRKAVVIEDDCQVKYYATDYRQWAARKAFGGM